MQPDKDSRPSAAELLNMVKSENMPEDKKVTGHGKHTVRVRDNKNNTTKLFWFLLSLVIFGGGLYCLINKKKLKKVTIRKKVKVMFKKSIHLPSMEFV